jgi:hypothetical protein
LAADKALSDLSEEQLRDVLEQLTDHNLPDSEKCPPVRRLNRENASKDESDLVISTFCKSSTPSSSTICRNSGRKSRYTLHKTGSKDAEFMRDKTNGNNSNKKVHSSQSLQDLNFSTNSDYDSMRSVGANRSGKRLNKASRANSFTMPSGSQNFCNNNNNVNKDNDLSSSPDLAISSNFRTNNSQQQLQSQHSSKSSRNKTMKSRPTSYISTSSVTAFCENESNNCSVKSNLVSCDHESEVSSTSSPLLESTISSRTYQECYATQSVHCVQDRDNHNMDCDKNSTSLCNSAHDKDFSDELQVIEMKDLRRKVKIIEYSSEKQNDSFESDSHNNKSSNSVDSFLELGLKSVDLKETVKTGVAERMLNHNLDYESTDLTNNLQEDNKSLQPYQGLNQIFKLLN